MSDALSHITVLDLSRILAGPWAAQLLADLGANVIKVERPDGGDDTRGWGPPFLTDPVTEKSADAAYFLCANRNKRSITVDFTTPEGKLIVRELAKKSDVVLENFKVGALKAYGLDYESLRLINPKLVYCSITGFGQTGPYAARAGYDFLVQAMGGLMSITGSSEGEPDAGPQKAGVAVADLLTGLYATVGVLAGLAHRDRTGEGQYVDVALLDVQVACLANQASNFLVSGTPPKRMGNRHPNIVPYQDFPTADGFMIIAIGNDTQFNRFVTVAGAPHLATDAQFSSNPQRVKNRDILIPALREFTKTKTTAQWIEQLEAVGVPCGPINDIEAVFDDPQIHAREMKISMKHAAAGNVSLVANPLRLSKSPVTYRLAPPQLGAHTREILESVLGMSAIEIDALSSRRIV